MRLIGKPGLQRNLAKWRIAAPNGVTSGADPKAPDIFRHRASKMFPKHTRQMNRVYSSEIADRLERKGLTIAVLEDFVRFFQPGGDVVSLLRRRSTELGQQLQNQALCGQL
jgi:hypothetical protein